MGNYSFKTTGLPEPVNGVVEGHNFTQGQPHTKIYDGYNGLTFRSCNLTNCDTPADSQHDQCLISQKSFCSHLHARWGEKGHISICADNCAHVNHIDTVTVDGVVVDINYSYSDTESM